ncbi:NAD(P)-dependent oxidoreductase [Mucilaginibacter sp. L196]|uniref:NAD(P)-dependent oxidoreductase n=1 Tax=Mucilaginibacter sp. L196 TaxID=1641870 RepID=UPI00131EA5D8|nr:NAD(P)-dependent oxidoreductase [Mucilaginibacter sp. L196]
MKIAVFGAGGRIGSRIVDEALRRGHDVTAAVRHPERYIKVHEHLKVAKADLFNSQDVETAAFNQDAVVVSYSPTNGAPASTLTEVVVPIINGLKQAHTKRLIIVGGAGSLEVAPGVQLVDTPDFPEAYKAVALAHREALKAYQKTTDLDWTFASPSAEITPGERTGKFRTAKNQLLTDANGKSYISMEDYAVGIIDEIENPMHIREVFTIGY